MSTSGNTVHICGASDDLVEIKAPGFAEEICSYEEPVHLAFSDGTTLTMEYGVDGWKATVHETGTAQVDIVPATDPEGSWPEYTDQVTISPVEWVERLGQPDLDGNADPVARWTIEPSSEPEFVGTQYELRGGAGALHVRDASVFGGAWQHIGSVRPHPNRGYRAFNLDGYPIASGEEAQHVITVAIEIWRKAVG